MRKEMDDLVAKYNGDSSAFSATDTVKFDQLNAQWVDYDSRLKEKAAAKHKKALVKQEAALQKEFDALENKTYSGIWKDDVTTADWHAKQGSIQAKIDYYEKQIKATSIPANIDLWKQRLADLDEFNTQGMHYHDLQTALNKVKAELKSLSKSGIISATDDAFSQARKDAALWAKSPKEADAALRGVSGEVWKGATDAQKDAIFEYTYSYSKYNEPLRGYEYGTEKFLGVGNVDLNEIGVNYGGFGRGHVKQLIDEVTDLIEQSSYTFDVWVQRGVKFKNMDRFFEINPDDFNLPESELQDLLMGKECIDYGFCSTGVSKGSGFTNRPIIMNIYAPSGTRMMYAEPFSEYGHGAKRSWDGVRRQTSFGSEAEMIFQRGTKFKITKVEKTGGTIYLDMEVVGQEVFK